VHQAATVCAPIACAYWSFQSSDNTKCPIVLSLLPWSSSIFKQFAESVSAASDVADTPKNTWQRYE